MQSGHNEADNIHEERHLLSAVCFSHLRINTTEIKHDGEKTNATEIKHDGEKTNATAQLKITTHLCPLWNTIHLT